MYYVMWSVDALAAGVKDKKEEISLSPTTKILVLSVNKQAKRQHKYATNAAILIYFSS